MAIPLFVAAFLVLLAAYAFVVLRIWRAAVRASGVQSEDAVSAGLLVAGGYVLTGVFCAGATYLIHPGATYSSGVIEWAWRILAWPLDLLMTALWTSRPIWENGAFMRGLAGVGVSLLVIWRAADWFARR
ncbi:hypothetical protein [Thetidibacter halocola]|uniref:Uncharacterized protein n=1 Tax=Thetidibacter halocola TaxID=2827239 RepID=A0A8J7WGV3_9RHOB|nr:hypothetical protein [Thetidibacter halocola]MBS0126582.1 hypothetical protein [Thetidibacter halocola]